MRYRLTAETREGVTSTSWTDDSSLAGCEALRRYNLVRYADTPPLRVSLETRRKGGYGWMLAAQWPRGVPDLKPDDL